MMKKLTKRFTALGLCVAGAAMLAVGCGKKNTDESASQGETTAQAVTEAPSATVTLGEYKGLELERVAAPEVTDEQIELQINYALSANPQKVPVTDRPAQEGDVVNIDYVGMKDGEAFKGGTAEGYDLELGSDTFIDGFEDGLIGANTGDELSLNLTFPENYGNAELAGQAVVFDVTVNAITEQKEAELNDEFVKRVSETSQTVEEYRAEIRKWMEDDARQSAEIEMQNAVMDLAVAGSTFEGLDEQVESEYQLQMEEITASLEQSQMTLADYTAMIGMDEESFKEYLRSDIENRIKVWLVAEAIAEEEGLEVDDDARMEVAKIYGLDSPDELVAAYGQEAVDEAARNVKVMNFLIANAKIVEPAAVETAEDTTAEDGAGETTESAEDADGAAETDAADEAAETE